MYATDNIVLFRGSLLCMCTDLKEWKQKTVEAKQQLAKMDLEQCETGNFACRMTATLHINCRVQSSVFTNNEPSTHYGTDAQGAIDAETRRLWQQGTPCCLPYQC